MNALPEMSERELQACVIDLARLCGWKVAHFRPAQTARGWRTPVQADGAGFPDLVMVRKGQLIFAELKARRGRLTVEQTVWLDALWEVAKHADDLAVQAYLWSPADWHSGVVEELLRQPERRAA